MTTVALDGRGAERGPEVIVAGAKAAAADGIRVRVFGDPAALSGLDGTDGTEIVEAADEITNDDDPVAAVRGAPQSSIVLAAADVAEGNSQALASAGPTGATMTAALFAMRRMHGVRRPALTVQLPVPGRDGPPTILLDVGANTEARPGDLVQFAHLGSAFSQAVLGIERPRVALLSVGEEAKKGSNDVVAAHEELAAGDAIDFRGNIEGRDLLGDAADVIVTDGFTGNVVLKTLEGTARSRRRRRRRRRTLESDGDAWRPVVASRRSAGCVARWIPTPRGARSCSACAASPSSATAAPARTESPMRSVWPRAP